jgi:hypothetical protein
MKQKTFSRSVLPGQTNTKKLHRLPVFGPPAHLISDQKRDRTWIFSQYSDNGLMVIYLVWAGES